MSKTKQNIFITNNLRETQKLAENLIKRLKKGDVLALYGNLGMENNFCSGFSKRIWHQKE